MKVHFIGIGGIGMSALARYFKAQGRAVSGSDRVSSEITTSLRKEGIRIMIGHNKNNIPKGVSVGVISQAIREDNPELAEAYRRGIRIYTYPQVIAQLTKRYQTIAIAGAHGKSTTTALAALALIKGGYDPTVIVGTNLKEFKNKNFRFGRGQYLVLEADEFGNAFSRYSPTLAIVTNIDREHLDVYKNLGNIKKAFLGFMANVVSGGTLILNRDDKDLYSLKSGIMPLAKKNKVQVVWYSGHDAPAKKIKNVIKIPGAHNISNASAVYDLGKALHIPEKKILGAIGSYRGAWRRMDYRGKMRIAAREVAVFDDYAHHPTEIKATLQAFREKFPHSPLVCVFQPHQAERLRLLFKEFRDAFKEADALILMPSYRVAGRETMNTKFTAEQLALNIKKKYPHQTAYYLPNPKNLRRFLIKKIAPVKPGVIIMMGAGNVFTYTNQLLH
jgi:UDP-N-acetylmuramate--alanine ligase